MSGVSDSHEDIKAAVSKVLTASWQRCRVPSCARPWACRPQRPVDGLGLHRHRLRPGRCDRRQPAMAPSRQSAQADGPQARRPDGQSRDRRARLHDVPKSAPRRAVQHQFAGTAKPKKRHRSEEIVAKLRQVAVLLLQRQSARYVTEVSGYHWRREFGDLRSDQVKRMKELEAENARLRRAVPYRDDRRDPRKTC